MTVMHCQAEVAPTCRPHCCRVLLSLVQTQQEVAAAVVQPSHRHPPVEEATDFPPYQLAFPLLSAMLTIPAESLELLEDQAMVSVADHSVTTALEAAASHTRYTVSVHVRLLAFPDTAAVPVEVVEQVAASVNCLGLSPMTQWTH